MTGARIGATLGAVALAGLALAQSAPAAVSFDPHVDYAAFKPFVDFTVGDEPQDVAAGFLDGDDKLDLVTANASSGDVSVLINAL